MRAYVSPPRTTKSSPGAWETVESCRAGAGAGLPFMDLSRRGWVPREPGRSAPAERGSYFSRIMLRDVRTVGVASTYRY